MTFEILAGGLVLGGLFFFITGTLGLLRFPDFYSRMHATGKCDTLGAFLLLAGLAILNGFSLASLKILFILVFIMILNPTATHALGRAGLRLKIPPWPWRALPDEGQAAQ